MCAIVLFFLFSISFLSSLPFPIQVNNINDSLSNELSIIVKKNNIFEIGYDIPSTSNLTTRDIDQYIPSSFFLPNHNVDLGIDKQNLLTVIADDRLCRGSTTMYITYIGKMFFP